MGTVGDRYDDALVQTVNDYCKAELVRGSARSAELPDAVGGTPTGSTVCSSDLPQRWVPREPGQEQTHLLACLNSIARTAYQLCSGSSVPCAISCPIDCDIAARSDAQSRLRRLRRIANSPIPDIASATTAVLRSGRR